MFFSRREREQQELERWHNMTEEERLAELRKNPKMVDNQVKKSKYKYLQKYYHRGAFFMVCFCVFFNSRNIDFLLG